MTSIAEAGVSQGPSAMEQLLVWYARSFPCRRGKLRVIDALWSRATGARATRTATLKYGGLKLPCDLSEQIQRQCYFFGTYFRAEQAVDCWRGLAARAGTIVDVGANVGIFSLAALAANPDAVVHAFEPTPELAATLRQVTILNGLSRLQVHELAVLRQAGRASLRRWRGEDGSNGGMNFVTTEPGGGDARPVETISIDEFCEREQIAQVDLLKIDVQGREHDVLAGAGRLLSDGRIGVVMFELNWAADSGRPTPADEAIRLLDAAGYRFAAPARRLRWRRPGPWMQRLDDVVASRAPEGEA